MTDIEHADLGIAAWESAAVGGEIFIMFFTGTVKENGDSWCGDCVATKHITSAVFEATKLQVITCKVTRDEWIGQPDQPYRKHPKLACVGVPSMLLCQGTNVLMRAESVPDFENEDLMEEEIIIGSCKIQVGHLSKEALPHPQHQELEQ